MGATVVTTVSRSLRVAEAALVEQAAERARPSRPTPTARRFKVMAVTLSAFGRTCKRFATSVRKITGVTLRPVGPRGFRTGAAGHEDGERHPISGGSERVAGTDEKGGLGSAGGPSPNEDQAAATRSAAAAPKARAKKAPAARSNDPEALAADIERT